MVLEAVEGASSSSVNLSNSVNFVNLSIFLGCLAREDTDRFFSINLTLVRDYKVSQLPKWSIQTR